MATGCPGGEGGSDREGKRRLISFRAAVGPWVKPGRGRVN